MSTDLIPFETMQQMGALIAQSGLFGVKNAVQATALMLVAQAEGLHPATIAGDYDVIQNRAVRKTVSVQARFIAAGGRIEWHQLDHETADATFSHPAGGSVRIDWTLEQARKAGLAGKDNWKGYSRAMLRSRCVAEGVRATYPAAIGGHPIDSEAQDMPPQAIGSIDNETGEIIGGGEATTAARGPRRKSETTQAAPPAAAPAPAAAKPEPAKAVDETEAAAKPEPAAARTGATGTLDAGKVAYLRGKLKSAGVEEESILSRFGAADLSGLRPEDFDTVKSELLALA